MLSLEETRISLLAKPSVVPKPAWLVHLMDTFQGIVCDIIKSTKLGNRSNFIKVKAWEKQVIENNRAIKGHKERNQDTPKCKLQNK